MILSLLLSADEIDRMEVMVKDIEKLRSDYSECKKELDKQILNNIIPFGELENSLKREIIEKNKTIQDYKKRLDKQTVYNIVPRVDTKKVINEKNKIIRSYKKRLNKEMFKNSILTSKLNSIKRDNNSEKPMNKLKKIIDRPSKSLEESIEKFALKNTYKNIKKIKTNKTKGKMKKRKSLAVSVFSFSQY